jgi:hypothetical protein
VIIYKNAELGSLLTYLKSRVWLVVLLFAGAAALVALLKHIYKTGKAEAAVAAENAQASGNDPQRPASDSQRLADDPQRPAIDSQRPASDPQRSANDSQRSAGNAQILEENIHQTQ